jgi:NAD(P)-dependent dehydrogenase (short-subunit alcohol dehydrogenase family)
LAAKQSAKTVFGEMSIMPEAVLKGRVALVTGVSRRKGIGLAIANQLAMLGADVFIHSFTPYDADREWGADGISALITTLQEHGSKIAHAEVLEFVRTANPQGRWGKPEDAARLIGWLATDDAQWITGQTINSNGGGL